MSQGEAPFIIRSVTAESVEADIARGFVAELPQKMISDLPEQIADGEVTMLVAESAEDGRPLGRVAIGWEGAQNPDIRAATGERVDIALLAVPEAERRRGIGIGLMLEAIATINEDPEGRNRGMCLSVEAGNPSIRIFNHLGFVALGKPIFTRGVLLQPMILPRTPGESPMTPAKPPSWPPR